MAEWGKDLNSFALDQIGRPDKRSASIVQALQERADARSRLEDLVAALRERPSQQAVTCHEFAQAVQLLVAL